MQRIEHYLPELGVELVKRHSEKLPPDRIKNRPIGASSQWDDSSHQRRRIHKSNHRKRCGPPQLPHIPVQSNIRKITPIGRRRRPAPIPSSPRGRGLVEPYRPLGPLPPRTVRAVARPGPHPVADGHLADVAAPAAPPCGLAAYGLHAGGLQALVHARVPHGRYAGMRGGQVVVAGEHLAPRAVRAARVRLALARSVRYEAGPLVALLALPPDALVGVWVVT